MHIQDGFLSAPWAIGWFGAASVFVAKGVSDVIRRSKQVPMFKPLMGLISAAVFFISLLPVPLPYLAAFGTSSHATGTPMAAILVGPFASMVMAVIALLLQALFFSHGGFTTLGANTFSMGVVGSLVGYGVFRLGRKAGLSLGVAAFFAGMLGDLSVYCTTSIQLALGVPGVTNIPVWKTFATVFMLFIPSQIPLAVIEGLVTGGMVSYIARVRPDILKNLGLVKDQSAREANDAF